MITPEIITAYQRCHLKAHFLLNTDKKGNVVEYSQILEEEIRKNREGYSSEISLRQPRASSYSPENMKKGIPFLIKANLESEDLIAYADSLTKFQ